MLNIFILNNVLGVVVYNEDEFIEAVVDCTIENITLGNDIDIFDYLKNKPIYITIDRDRIIDLNGHNLNINNGYSNNGTCGLIADYLWYNTKLTIKDSKYTGNISAREIALFINNKNSNNYLLIEGCNMNVQGGLHSIRIFSNISRDNNINLNIKDTNFTIDTENLVLDNSINYNIISANIESEWLKYFDVDGKNKKISEIVNNYSDIYIDGKISNVNRDEILDHHVCFSDIHNAVSIVEKKYKVEFNTSGGTYIEPQYVSYNSLINEIESPEKDGYEFRGWSKNGERFAISKTPITEDTVLEAIWEKDKIYLNENDIIIDYTNVYKGIDTKPTPIVNRKGIELNEGTDYEYLVDEEEQRIVVMGRGEYRGVIVLYYDIVDIQYTKGDLDRNNVVDANDASIALEIYKAENATAEDIAIGDMDGNNLIDANDASLILELYKTNN